MKAELEVVVAGLERRWPACRVAMVSVVPNAYATLRVMVGPLSDDFVVDLSVALDVSAVCERFDALVAGMGVAGPAAACGHFEVLELRGVGFGVIVQCASCRLVGKRTLDGIRWARAVPPRASRR